MRTAHGILAKYQIRDIITTLYQIKISNIRILYVVYLKKNGILNL